MRGEFSVLQKPRKKKSLAPRVLEREHVFTVSTFCMSVLHLGFYFYQLAMLYKHET